MTHQQEKLRDFFQRYALASLGPEPQKIAGFYGLEGHKPPADAP